MRDMLKRKNGQKGFTLVELIVVMAILAVLAAIAVPRYTGIQNTAKVKADGSTAMAIIHAARLQESATGTAVDSLADGAGSVKLKETYMAQPVPIQAGDKFVLSKDSGNDEYKVTWKSNVAGYNEKDQAVLEKTMGSWTPVEE
jgi:type IV pilus assembly protein PilA